MTAISVGMQRRRINYFAHFWQNYTVKQPFLLYQLWKYYGADVTCWQVSQNHRILRLAGTSGGQMAQASAQAGQQESGLCPRSFLNLQGLHNLSRKHAPVFNHLHNKNCFLLFRFEFNVFQSMSTASCSGTEHPKKNLAVLYLSFRYFYTWMRFPKSCIG